MLLFHYRIQIKLRIVTVEFFIEIDTRISDNLELLNVIKIEINKL